MKRNRRALSRDLRIEQSAPQLIIALNNHANRERSINADEVLEWTNEMRGTDQPD